MDPTQPQFNTVPDDQLDLPTVNQALVDYVKAGKPAQFADQANKVAQGMYWSLQKQGQLKTGSGAAIGHNLRANFAIDDPTQGGILPQPYAGVLNLNGPTPEPVFRPKVHQVAGMQPGNDTDFGYVDADYDYMAQLDAQKKPYLKFDKTGYAIYKDPTKGNTYYDPKGAKIPEQSYINGITTPTEADKATELARFNQTVQGIKDYQAQYGTPEARAMQALARNTQTAVENIRSLGGDTPGQQEAGARSMHDWVQKHDRWMNPTFKKAVEANIGTLQNPVGAFAKVLPEVVGGTKSMVFPGNTQGNANYKGGAVGSAVRGMLGGDTGPIMQLGAGEHALLQGKLPEAGSDVSTALGQVYDSATNDPGMFVANIEGLHQAGSFLAKPFVEASYQSAAKNAFIKAEALTASGDTAGAQASIEKAQQAMATANSMRVERMATRMGMSSDGLDNASRIKSGDAMSDKEAEIEQAYQGRKLRAVEGKFNYSPKLDSQWYNLVGIAKRVEGLGRPEVGTDDMMHGIINRQQSSPWGPADPSVNPDQSTDDSIGDIFNRQDQATPAVADRFGSISDDIQPHGGTQPESVDQSVSGIFGHNYADDAVTSRLKQIGINERPTNGEGLSTEPAQASPLDPDAAIKDRLKQLGIPDALPKNDAANKSTYQQGGYTDPNANQQGGHYSLDAPFELVGPSGTISASPGEVGINTNGSNPASPKLEWRNNEDVPGLIESNDGFITKSPDGSGWTAKRFSPGGGYRTLGISDTAPGAKALFDNVSEPKPPATIDDYMAREGYKQNTNGRWVKNGKFASKSVIDASHAAYADWQTKYDAGRPQGPGQPVYKGEGPIPDTAGMTPEQAKLTHDAAHDAWRVTKDLFPEGEGWGEC